MREFDALVRSAPWVRFSQIMESENKSIVTATAHGLRWQMSRQVRDDEVIYVFKITHNVETL